MSARRDQRNSHWLYRKRIVEDFKLALARKPARNAKKEARDEETPRLSAKSINNCLTILRRMLVIARKRKLIAIVPEI
ncbi:MAG: hypothetical protein ACKV2T_37015 [Kofleriaceae bacterium]